MASYVVLWLLVAVLTVLVLLLYRQYGKSLLPAKARMQLEGLDVGAGAPSLWLTTHQDAPPFQLRLGGTPAAAERPAILHVLLFASSTCPICARLWDEVGVLPATYEAVEFWWIDSGTCEADRQPPLDWKVGCSQDRSAHDAMEVPALPFAYALDPDGIVRAKGLMNDLEDFRQLVTAAAQNLRPSPARSTLLPVASASEAQE
jgi:methylamine dehydrogenase accessory protein MauD